MQDRIKPHLHLAESQHGFRTGRSTTTALLLLTYQVIRGFNEKSPPSRTVAMALDFSKAFDTVNHIFLLKQILNTTLDNNSIRWLSTYLRGRTAAVTYLNTTSKQRIIRTGVPQGSVLSPLLFNFYVSDFPPTSLSTHLMPTILRRGHRPPAYPQQPRSSLAMPMTWQTGQIKKTSRSPHKNPLLPFSHPKIGNPS